MNSGRMRLTLTWPRLLFYVVTNALLAWAVASAGNENVNTWGVYLYMGLGVCFVAGVMTLRTVRAGGWTPRVFLFTWWMWMIGGLLLFIAYTSFSTSTANGFPPPQPRAMEGDYVQPLRDGVKLLVRGIAFTATNSLVLVLLSQPQRRALTTEVQRTIEADHLERDGQPRINERRQGVL